MVVEVVEGVSHVVRRPGHTVTLAGRVCAGGDTGLRGRVMMLLLLLLLAMVMGGVLMVVVMMVSGLETAVVGRVVERP